MAYNFGKIQRPKIPPTNKVEELLHFILAVINRLIHIEILIEFLFTGIRRIQSILLKVSLVLGAQVYRGVEFCGLEEPDDDHDSSGWRINVNPSKHPVNLLNVDVLIGAEGKRVSVPGKNDFFCWMDGKNALFVAWQQRILIRMQF